MRLGGKPRIQQERRSDANRRSGVDRRQAASDAAGAKRPNTEDRRESERRKMHFGVRVATTRSLTTIEEFLDAECRGEWFIALEGIDDDLTRKQVRLVFELEEDKNHFLERFRR